VFTAFKIGFQANLANKNIKRQNTRPVQTSKPKSGNIKSIFVCFLKFKKRKPQPTVAVSF
jgi:hypothetical protein